MFLVVALVIAAGYFFHPFSIGKVPVDGFLQAFFKLKARNPTQFFLQFLK